MVSLGINIFSGIVYAYDEATKKQTRTKFKKIHPSEKSIIVFEKFFCDIKLKFGKIGNVWLMKARISTGEERLQKYDCYSGVQDSIACFISNRKILEIPVEQILPLKRVIPVQKERGDTFLNIRLDKYWERVFLPPENGFNLEFIVDINGIYSFKFLKYEPSYVILNPLNREWIKVPNMPGTYTSLTGIYKYEENMDVVAIDLGMSKCCLAVGRNGGIKMVALGNTGSYLLPSYISFRQNEPICGEIAVKDLQFYTNFTVFDVKRIIGKEYSDVNVNGIWPFKVVDAGDEPVIRIERNGAPILFSPSQVSAVLLKYIKKTAEDYQGRSLKHAVITVPAAFTFSQKRDTLEAAKIAGWEKVDLLLEPIAAAFSIKDLVANTLIKAQYAPNNIDMIILAGGGCRMPMIREMLKEMFPGSEIRSQNNVEEVVAFGAARYACNLLKDTSGDKCNIM
uniref:Uncharacterized protein n=1 Tax=Panagrolaimus sp. PS1159 TaxID=55785 RepID=A0AC35FKH3_9BILA